jgi:hypothetical protein
VSRNERFLSRWSRRKEASQREGSRSDDTAAEAPDEGSYAGPTSVGAGSPAVAPESDMPLELPPIDTLTTASDFSAFMRAGVPDAVRIAALRRLWAIDPEIRNFIGHARDYAWDWNAPGDVPGSGPLLPSDDIKRLLARAFGQDDKENEATGARLVDHGTGEPEQIGSDRTRRRSEAPSSSTDPAQMPDSRNREDAAQHNASIDAASHRERATKGVTAMRIGRHGGAIPK